MRVLAWLIILCVAMTKAMPGARLTQNSQQTAQTEEQKEEGDGEDHSPFHLRRRMISSQKTFALKSTIKAVKDSLRIPTYPWH